MEKNNNKEKKKIDKGVIFKKVVASLLVAFTVLGTCYSFIYLIVHA